MRQAPARSPSVPSGKARMPPAARALLHGLAAALVVIGVVAQVWRPTAPALGPLADPGVWFEPEFLDRVRAYQDPRYVAWLVGLLARVALVGAVALTAAGRRAVERVVGWIGSQRPARAAAVAAVLLVVMVDVVLLPLSLWVGFVHESAFGFRTTGLGGWARDWLTRRLLGWAGVGMVVLAGYALARRVRQGWPAVAGLAGSALAAVVVLASPLVIEPLWHRTESLPEGELRESIEELAERAGAPTDRVLVADASRRTTKQNAYVSGLGTTRRIVLYDTLLAARSPREVSLVTAHELGHKSHNDLARGVLAGGAAIVASSYALWMLMRWRVRRGRQSHVADPTAVAVAVALVVLLQAAALPVESALSRRAEAAADAAAIELTGDPQTFVRMMDGLARANLSDPDPPRWVYALWFSHPTAAQRLERAATWAADPST